MRRLVPAIVCLAALASPSFVLAQQKETVQGYAEWRTADVVVVDGQRVLRGDRTKFSDKRWDDIELGDEMKAEGTRQADGALLATSVTAKANGVSMFEEDALAQADAAEQEWLEAGEIEGDEGEPAMRIYTRGRAVDRVREVVDQLLPSYLDPERFRFYVVENKEWNAFAMANGSVWVHTGLLKDLNDEELAIVLGHELAHVTHEHIRKSMKKDMWYSLLQGGVALATDSSTAAVIAGGISLVRENKYSRDLEDQADRVGLRYAYEAGFDTAAAPALWRRFDEKYGSEDKLTNFLFGDHSRSVDRIRKLDAQIALNYRGGADSRTRRSYPGAGNANADTARRPERSVAQQADESAVVSPRTPTRKRGRPPVTGAPAPQRTIAEALASLKQGMAPVEVKGLLGEPVSTEGEGSRLLWHYDEFDVVFADGRVSKVQPR